MVVVLLFLNAHGLINLRHPSCCRRVTEFIPDSPRNDVMQLQAFTELEAGRRTVLQGFGIHLVVRFEELHESLTCINDDRLLDSIVEYLTQC